jgi:hypothetical protein
VDVRFGSWSKCFQKLIPGGSGGDGSQCGWVVFDVATLFAGTILRPIADAIKAADASLRFGIGFAEAYAGLRAAGLSEEAIAGITSRIIKELRERCLKGKPKSLLRAGAKAARAGTPCTEWGDDYGSGSKGVLGSIDKDGVLNLVVLAEEGLTPTGSEMLADVMGKIGGNAKGMRGTWLGGGDMKDNLDSFNAGIQSLKLTPEEAARLTFTGKQATKYGFTGRVQIEKLEGTPGNYTKVEVVFWKPS